MVTATDTSDLRRTTNRVRTNKHVNEAATGLPTHVTEQIRQSDKLPFMGITRYFDRIDHPQSRQEITSQSFDCESSPSTKTRNCNQKFNCLLVLTGNLTFCFRQNTAFLFENLTNLENYKFSWQFCLRHLPLRSYIAV